ncbi:MAG TPA: molybdopterin-dependent oxidoreductase [Vicinamibacterales bacterium]|nr:molybdopterin-dependent oxidoreductase [Vicinamibacterales bacterium]
MTVPARCVVRQIAISVSTLILAASLHASQQAAAPAPAQDATLSVAGDVAHPLTITTADLKGMPRTTVTITDQGREVKYSGVLVGEVLARAGAALGRDLSGPAVSTYVLASAKDGYQAVFSLAELDPAFTSNEIIIADSVDGQPLFEYQGPFRLVAPHDKRGARSVRMLQRLEVVRLKK